MISSRCHQTASNKSIKHIITLNKTIVVNRRPNDNNDTNNNNIDNDNKHIGREIEGHSEGNDRPILGTSPDVVVSTGCLRML